MRALQQRSEVATDIIRLAQYDDDDEEEDEEEEEEEEEEDEDEDEDNNDGDDLYDDHYDDVDNFYVEENDGDLWEVPATFFAD